MKSAPYPKLKAFAEPEVGGQATDCSDNDGDGQFDDQPVFTDTPLPLAPPPSPCPPIPPPPYTGVNDWRGTPEILLNGINDDGDTFDHDGNPTTQPLPVIDDGVILPVREVRFVVDY